MATVMEDRSGEPRSEDDLLEAKSAVTRALINPQQLPPGLVVLLPTIRDALSELLLRRAIDERGKTT